MCYRLSSVQCGLERRPSAMTTTGLPSFLWTAVALFLVVASRGCLGVSYHSLGPPGAVISNKNCGGLTNCLDSALNVIHSSERYSLFESLWFDAINGTNNSYVITTSDPKGLTDLAKKAAELFNSHYLVWRVAPGLNVKVFKKNRDEFGMSVLRDVYPPKTEARTFGIGKRRIMTALLPIMYKLGVITTLLAVLTVVSLKGLTVGVILLFLSLAGITAKLKGAHGLGHHSPGKEVHIHIEPPHWAPPPRPEHYYHHHGDWNAREAGGYDRTTADDEGGYDATTHSWSYLPPFMGRGKMS